MRAPVVTNEMRGQGLAEDTSEREVECYQSLAGAIASIGAGVQQRMRVERRVPVVANLVIPANIILDFESGHGFLDIGNGVTVTLQSPEHVIAQPRQRIKSGAGILAFGATGIVYPQWWGAVADGVADDTSIIEEACASLVNGGTCYLPAATYGIADLTIDEHSVLLKGAGRDLVSDHTYPSATLLLALQGATRSVYVTGHGVIVQDLAIDGNDIATKFETAGSGYGGLKNVFSTGHTTFNLDRNSTSSTFFRDCHFIGKPVNSMANGTSFENCHFNGAGADICLIVRGSAVWIGNANVFESYAGYAIHVTGSGKRGINIIGNYFESAYACDATIHATGLQGSQILSNYFADISTEQIVIATCNRITVRDNYGGRGVTISGTFDSGEVVDNDGEAIVFNGQTGLARVVAIKGGQKIVYNMAAAPVAGTWSVGDIVYNSAPAAAGNIGWVCTTGGTPGTWKTFGSIAA